MAAILGIVGIADGLSFAPRRLTPAVPLFTSKPEGVVARVSKL
jgi:hypothetical protein